MFFSNSHESKDGTEEIQETIMLFVMKTQIKSQIYMQLQHSYNSHNTKVMWSDSKLKKEYFGLEQLKRFYLRGLIIGRVHFS